LVELETEVHPELPDGHPAEEMFVESAVIGGLVHQADEKHRADGEGRQYGRAAQQMTPAIGGLATEQQDHRTEQRKRYQEP
jgi:hypothetical protein